MVAQEQPDVTSLIACVHYLRAIAKYRPTVCVCDENTRVSIVDTSDARELAPVVAMKGIDTHPRSVGSRLRIYALSEITS